MFGRNCENADPVTWDAIEVCKLPDADWDSLHAGVIKLLTDITFGVRLTSTFIPSPNNPLARDYFLNTQPPIPTVIGGCAGCIRIVTKRIWFIFLFFFRSFSGYRFFRQIVLQKKREQQHGVVATLLSPISRVC
jgi:hypothetical protein